MNFLKYLSYVSLSSKMISQFLTPIFLQICKISKKNIYFGTSCILSFFVFLIIYATKCYHFSSTLIYYALLDCSCSQLTYLLVYFLLQLLKTICTTFQIFQFFYFSNNLSSFIFQTCKPFYSQRLKFSTNLFISILNLSHFFGWEDVGGSGDYLSAFP